MVNIGPKIGIEGEADYRKQINNIVQSTKTLKSEYNALSQAATKSMNPFKNFTNELKLNAEKHKVLHNARQAPPCVCYHLSWRMTQIAKSQRLICICLSLSHSKC